MTLPLIDGHNDFLLRLLHDPQNRDAIWLNGNGKGHLDLPRMQKGHFAGGFFAIYIPSPRLPDQPDFEAMFDNPPYTLPLPNLIDHGTAQPIALAKAGHLLAMERLAPTQFKLCRTVQEIESCMAQGIIFGIMHMEGAEAIDPNLDALHAFHAMGLRSLGPVWSRPTVFGHGVPFAYPSGPDTGPGLTDAGIALIRECNQLGIMIDLSHLNEKGFDDVARISTKPLVATHSNAHALTPSSRNLTDRQLTVIKDSKGMVGLNFATVFLSADGRQQPDIGWDPMIRHLDYLINHLGEDHVGFGSDFDGATVPSVLADVTGLPAFQEALKAYGYNDALLRKLCSENWLSVLRRTWS
jgi:membrane dipeptidase